MMHANVACVYFAIFVSIMLVNAQPGSITTTAETKIICENDTKILECAQDKLIFIKHSTYGRSVPHFCNENWQKSFKTFAPCVDDVTQIVGYQCDGKSSCHLNSLSIDVKNCEHHQGASWQSYLMVLYTCS